MPKYRATSGGSNLLTIKMIVLALEEAPKNKEELIELSIQYGSSYRLTKEQVNEVLNTRLIDLI